MKKVFRSIRFRFPMFVIGVLALVISALIVVNSNYLGTYTTRVKLRTISYTIELIRDYVDSGYSEEALIPMERTIRKSNLDVLILDNMDTLPQVIYASDINDNNNSKKMISYFYGNVPNAQEVYQTNDEFVIYKAYDPRLGSYQIDCLGMVQGTGTGFILTTPLESIEETVSLSTQLLIILGISAMVIGAVIMYLVTLSLTRPIRELSELSRQMAELNFDVRYQGRSHEEIDVLGESMNQMSDRLKRTIADLRSANLQLEKDLKEKERIDEMRRQFLSNVSHELKTPIALIQGYSEGLKDGITEDPESMEFYCDVIIDETQKMNTIVKRLLNLDEIETGQMEIHREVFCLSELIEGVAKTSRMLAPEGSSCELVLRVAPDIMVNADEFMIEQAVQNYMSNAYHYVGDPGTITVSTILHDGHVIVSVHNTGSAIPEEDIEHIWEKFYKVDKARTRAYGGSGIGLSIVKAIMNSHGGRYGVRNRDGGVEFWFEIETA